MKNGVLLWFSAWCVLLGAGPVYSAGRQDDRRYLIIHADDAGMCHSANRATIKAMEKGIVSSASIMVPCPWFPEIAEYAKNHPERDFGIHLTLTAEWKHYRWGPVSPRDKVPSLVDDRGFLWAKVADVARNVKVEEAEIELRAQIERAVEFGVPITHLDTHMGAVACRPDLVQLYVQLGIEYGFPVLFCRTFRGEIARQSPHLAQQAEALAEELQTCGLPVVDYLPTIPTPDNFDARKAVLLHAFACLRPGVTQIIIHCGYDDPELRAVTNRSASRDLDRRVFMDPDVRSEADKLGIQIISWKQLHHIAGGRPNAAQRQ